MKYMTQTNEMLQDIKISLLHLYGTKAVYSIRGIKANTKEGFFTLAKV